jgi:hypothetical protein
VRGPGSKRSRVQSNDGRHSGYRKWADCVGEEEKGGGEESASDDAPFEVRRAVDPPNTTEISLLG